MQNFFWIQERHITIKTVLALAQALEVRPAELLALYKAPRSLRLTDNFSTACLIGITFVSVVSLAQ